MSGDRLMTLAPVHAHLLYVYAPCGAVCASLRHPIRERDPRRAAAC